MTPTRSAASTSIRAAPAAASPAATGDVSGTIDDVNITDTGTAGTQPGLELDATTGTFAVSNFTVSTNGATGVRLNNAGTVTFAPTGNISITSAGAAGLTVTGTWRHAASAPARSTPSPSPARAAAA